MANIGASMAKLAGIATAVESVLRETFGRGNMVQSKTNYKPIDVEHYFTQAAASLEVLRAELPDLFGDFILRQDGPETEMSMKDTAGNPVYHYSRAQVERLSRDISQIIEIRTNSGESTSERQAPRRVFISHGRAKDWYEVQRFIEKDLGIETMELAQEVDGGQTIIEKLENRSDDCDSAVIVMSGDDADENGKPKVRENVMHEIGFFHGKFGRSRVILVHEDGVSVPTNLAGIVYTPYPKDKVSAAFHKLGKELAALYNL